MMKKLTLLLLLAGTLTGHGQSTDVWTHFKGKFSDEAAVFVERSEVLNITIEGDSLKVFSDIFEDILHLKDQADVFSSKRVYGSHFTQVGNLKAKTLVWDKNRYKEMNVSDFKKNSDRSSGVFYDDSYYYSFNFPSVASRNRTQLQYREDLKDARFIGGYVFPSYLPQGKTRYAIKASKDVEIAFQVLHDKEKAIQFKKTEKGGYVYYEWSAENLAAYKNEQNSPEIRYYVPHVICYVKSYQTKKGKINVLSNLDDLYAWYRVHLQNLNVEPSQELVGIVKKIESTSSSEIELVKNVFYWVQQNIQYIAFEQGMRGLIPHNGSYVCEKRYGDCKDMANLIVNMLQVANVKSYHTWVGSRDLPYRYSDFPTPLVDNHMIATYVAADGTYYFLDATSDYTAFGYPSSMIQGKEVLIAYDSKKYEVREVPVIAPEKNVMTDSIRIRLEGNEIIGSGTCSLNGFTKVFGGYELDRAEQEDVKKYVASLIGKGSNKFFLDQYNVANLENRDLPTQIDYKFRVADYFQKINNEIYVNLCLRKDYYNDYINKTRVSPKEIEYQYDDLEVIEMDIPEGYEVEYLPADAAYNGNLLGYEITYKAAPGKILFSKKLRVSYLLMQPEHFEQWNESVKQISEAYKESIILKKK